MSAMDDKKLSSNVLQMKFMQRSKRRMDEEEQEVTEKKLEKAYLATDEHADNAQPGPSTRSKSKLRPIIYEHRFDLLEDLLFGRMSFKGSNPDVEKLMIYYRELKNGGKQELEDGEVDASKDIQDQEMANRLGAERTVGKRFKTKRQRANDNDNGAQLTSKEVPSQPSPEKRRRFMKPRD